VENYHYCLVQLSHDRRGMNSCRLPTSAATAAQTRPLFVHVPVHITAEVGCRGAVAGWRRGRGPACPGAWKLAGQ
jgi:hypothetical protein